MNLKLSFDDDLVALEEIEKLCEQAERCTSPGELLETIGDIKSIVRKALHDEGEVIDATAETI